MTFFSRHGKRAALMAKLNFLVTTLLRDPVLFLLISVVLLGPRLLMQELRLATRVIKVSF